MASRKALAHYSTLLGWLLGWLLSGQGAKLLVRWSSWLCATIFFLKFTENSQNIFCHVMYITSCSDVVFCEIVHDSLSITCLRNENVA
ncbi:MAG: hypothetical protein QOF89_4789 [Acidobacteriota bacterium]|nr:hypothetical protein [Acidobacteriota bacterium]